MNSKYIKYAFGKHAMREKYKVLIPHLHSAIAAVPRAAVFHCQNTSVAAS
jgi:hypothetical protein